MHRILVSLAGGAILYGSLYPFSFQAPSADAWHDLWHWHGFLSSPGDMLGNLALFMPWGLFSTMAWRARHGLTLAMWLSALSGLGLALLAQVAQLAVPARDPALVDVFWNMVGCGAGLALASAWQITTAAGTARSRQLQPMLLLAACAVAEWLPLVPSVDWALVKSHLRDLQATPLGSVSTMAEHAMLQLVLGWALAHWFSGWRLTWAQAGALVVLMAGKLVLVQTRVDMDTLLGALVGVVLSVGLRLASRRGDTSWPSAAMVWSCLALFTAGALWPGTLRDSMAPFNWLPMAGLLQGDMLQNTRALALTLVVFMGMVIAAQGAGASAVGFSISLATWVLLLELAQGWIETRSGDISTPLLALLAGFLVAATAPTAGRSARADQPSLRREPAVESTRALPAGQRRRWLRHPAWIVACTLLPLVLALHLGLRAPGLPYNVRELFIADGHVGVLAVFAVMLLWMGAGPAWLGRLLSASRVPWLWLPLGAVACALVALVLLTASTTSESLDDVAGSNNLHWFVTQKDLWGPWWRALFLRLNAPDLIAFIERGVRWAALYGPLPLVLAAMVAIVQRDPRRPGARWWMGSLLLAGGMTLWLCKAIAFDWSSTDNLNELIARDGPWGWGGGGWLLTLLLAIGGNALLLASAWGRGPWAWMGGASATVLALPAGWWLLNAGLDPAVEKYGQVFSGAQFLLGPDRQQLLSDSVLQLRWFAVQLALVTVIAMGIGLERQITAWWGLRR